MARDSLAMAIPFIDINAQKARLQDRLDQRINAVLDHGKFIMGPEVGELEGALAALSGAPHAITCSSGTDALVLPLMALGVGAGDAVLVPTFTFAATAEVVPPARRHPGLHRHPARQFQH